MGFLEDMETASKLSDRIMQGWNNIINAKTDAERERLKKELYITREEMSKLIEDKDLPLSIPDYERK